MSTKIKTNQISIDSIYPVGSIYITTVSTNPSTYFGGTWVAFGAGKTLVGLDSGDTDFDTVEETGGAKSHQHAQGGIGGLTANGSGGIQYGSWNDNGGFGVSSTTINFANYSSDVATAGVGASVDVYPWLTQDVSSLQPYIVTYMFKRTA